MKKILILSAFDSIGKNKSSGTPYYITEILRKKSHVVNVGNNLPSSLLLLIKIYYKIKKIIFKKNQLQFMNNMIVLISRYYYNKKNILSHDLIIAPWGSSLISGINLNHQIIYITDATFNSMLGYNNLFTNLSRKTIDVADKIERTAVNKATLVTVPSTWAYNALVEYYHVDPNKIVLAEYGPNLDNIPSYDDVIKSKKISEKLRLLFVGKGWYNKGADKAIKVFELLKKNKIDCELFIVGSRSPNIINDVDINIMPMLDKNNVKDQEKLTELYMSSHFFILPTLYECFGIVFSEASAFGVPILASNTGGVSNAVCSGENGYLFDVNANAEEYANLIINLWNNKTLYETQVKKTRQYYEKILNWDVWYSKVFDNHIN
jgi:glycosyltransferase involved in cell wall biosynthesis